MKARLQRGFLLDGVLVEPLAGLVTHRDRSSHLPPKAVDVLIELAKKPGILVSHEALLETVWGNRNLGHEILSRAVSDIRQALGDQYDNPRFIQTVHRRGYRLLVKPEFSDLSRKSHPTTDSLTVIETPPFLTELMRRKVVKTGAIYLVVGWLLVQIADTTFDKLPLPAWAALFVTNLVVIGFPISLLLSWFFEIADWKVRVDGHSPTSVNNTAGIAYLAVVVALVLSAAGLYVYQLVNKDGPPIYRPPYAPATQQLPVLLDIPVLPNSLAVMRFVNIGGDERLSDGLSENLLHLLSGLSELSVPSRTSVWSLSGAELSTTQIAERLHVRYVLEGSVLQAGQNIRVTAQLIDGRSGHHLWSEVYDRQFSALEFFSILDDIAVRVVERLQSTLSLEPSKIHARPGTTSELALEQYLLGMERLREPKSDESLDQAVAAFGLATREDAHFTEAHAGLCEAYLAWFIMTRNSEFFENAEKSCLRALTLDDSLAEVYAAIGSLHRYAGRYDDAQHELERARELLPHSASVLEELGRVYRAQNKLALAEKTFNEAIMQEPSSWSVYKSLGNFLFRTGRYEEAIPLYKYVIELAPDQSPGYNNLGVAYYMLGRFSEAIKTWDHVIDRSPTRSTLMNYANSYFYLYEFEQSVRIYEKALEMAPNDFRIWENLSASLRHVPGQQEREDECRRVAISLAEDALQVNPNDSVALSRISLLYVRAGMGEAARRSMERLYANGWDDPDVSFILALTLLELGDHQGALDELERAVDMGFPIVLIQADPDFESLRESPRFAVLTGNSQR